MGIDKLVPDAAAAVADIRSGASIGVGGFGACGLPIVLINALLNSGTDDLEIVSNNCGTDDYGLGALLVAGRLRRVTASYIGDNPALTTKWLAGEIELELVPQGTLAERLRAGGSGIAAFYTRAGVATPIADGGLPWRYAPDGTVAVASPPRRVELFDGVPHVLEHATRTDVALVRAARGDRTGNLVFHATARNFNPLVAMAGRLTIAEVEEVVEELPPDEVHLPGVFVQRVVVVPEGTPKRIDRLTVQGQPEEWGIYR
ncbi:CoA transferase subunit A [Cryptosporangium aurantiacum]|uniref:CoA transferase subunit A n=1 Tax=Cryptosporangium aurantiacum TaxID=134849 RepID=UPI000932908F|nr:3-oxoacid CoA-transferase subunit A [Cryptosporangium aurantiacum]